MAGTSFHSTMSTSVVSGLESCICDIPLTALVLSVNVGTVNKQYKQPVCAHNDCNDLGINLYRDIHTLFGAYI